MTQRANQPTMRAPFARRSAWGQTSWSGCRSTSASGSRWERSTPGAVGVGARALELAVAHARERVQFGRPIGAYQAVAHPLADAFVELELARSLAWWAAWCVADDEADRTLAAAAAKATAADAAVATCERSIQTHGGVGFTWESPLNGLYRRALWIQSWDASGATLRAEVAAQVLDEEGAT